MTYRDYWNIFLYTLVILNMVWGAYAASNRKHDVGAYFMAWAILFYVMAWSNT